MSFSFSCGDVMPGCAATFEAETEEQLLGEIGAHAAEGHGIVEVTPEILAQVRAKVRSV